MVPGELPFGIIFVLENNSSKEILRLLNIKAFFLEKYAGVKLVQLLILNVSSKKVLKVFRNT